MMTSEKPRLSILPLGLLIALTCSLGCSVPKWETPKLLNLDNAWPWGEDDEPKVETPIRVVGLWTDTILHQPGQVPQRGFGGRLLFYGKDPNKSVLVEGQLVVYAFDEAGRHPTDNKPTRRYVFPPDQIPLHKSDSPVGTSYSFWLPWDEAGGQKTEVSLICRFEPKGGAVITSEQTRHLLPGTTPTETQVAASGPPKLPEGVASRPAQPDLMSQIGVAPPAAGAQQASYQAAVPVDPAVGPAAHVVPTANAVPRQMTTTSIALPQHYQIPATTVPARAATTGPSAGQQAAAVAAPSNVFQPPPAPSPKISLPPGLAAQQPSLAAQPIGPSNAYQPQQRITSPPVYSPTYSTAARTQSFVPQAAPQITPPTVNIPQAIQQPQVGVQSLPAAAAMQPAAATPQHQPYMPAQQMQQLQQQVHQPQQMIGQPAVLPQSGPQPIAPPTHRAAAVSYW